MIQSFVISPWSFVERVPAGSDLPTNSKGQRTKDNGLLLVEYREKTKYARLSQAQPAIVAISFREMNRRMRDELPRFDEASLCFSLV